MEKMEEEFQKGEAFAKVSSFEKKGVTWMEDILCLLQCHVKSIGR